MSTSGGIGDQDLRDDLMTWARRYEQGEDEEENKSWSYGNLAVLSGLGLVGALGLVYFSSSKQPSPEARAGIYNQEYEIEEEYIPFEDEQD